ncbi:MAG: LPS export ABC transporter periplasmic protein LptC [Deltaproteobacteria bacterium]|nr:LPS export ABC transporter periplasmic protein LptC [Deltaproteobacteria bacterium]
MWAISRDTADKAAEPARDVAEGSVAKVQGFKYARTLDGEVEWEVKAAEAVYTPGKEEATFSGVEAEFFTEAQGTVRVKGDQGTFDSEQQNLNLENHVRVDSSMGYSMSTDKLRYTQDDKTIRSEGLVYFHGDGMAMSGEHLTIRLDDELIELTGNVKTSIWNTGPLQEAAP